MDEWTMKDGSTIMIFNMTSDHLYNTITMLGNRYIKHFNNCLQLGIEPRHLDEYVPELESLLQEFESRGLDFATYSPTYQGTTDG